MALSNKSEPSTSNGSISNEQLILAAVVAGGTKGCFDDDIEKTVPNLKIEERVQIMNSLITKRQIDIYEASGGKLLYKARSGGTDTPASLKGADLEEKIVYDIIKEAGNKGIWMRDIRFQSKLHDPSLKKIIKALENKKIIKAIKSISGTRKVVYMLTEFEPDTSITGGAWYTDQDFESEFVDVLNQQCYRYLLELKQQFETNTEVINKGPIALYNMISANTAQVCKYITDLGISKVPLSEDDIQAILETLVFDGKVIKQIRGSEVNYRAVNRLTETAGICVVPCGVCPVMANCCPDIGAVVSPQKCPYITLWGTLPVIKMDTVREEF